ncbi:hypothetical protein [Nocardioides sp.]|uniref:hypothetical protein n=1 Tax=Nocardioides sp. TaxID=35761 RepID=UPI002736656D|nr:hypothetical protein [Nocardioides sp.]MDP3892659.1 hypothetical protein [Nocardioides sp.]
MRKPTLLLAPLAAAAFTLAAAPVASADHANGSYQTTLNPLNGSSGSGMATIAINGDQATIDLSWSGLPETFMDGPYPHVQHIHIGGRGECPTPSADKNGDGVVDTPEGQPAYGEIGTTLSLKGDTSPAAGTNIKIAPAGSSVDYSRTITLDEPTLDALAEGTGVIVVHGLDPATLSEEAANAMSSLVPELPLAATAPALCGALAGMPAGGVETGGGNTGGIDNLGLLGAGGGLLAVAAVAGVAAQRRRVASIDS